MKGRSSRTRQIGRLIILLLLLASVLAGPFATPALARKPSASDCTFEGERVTQVKVDGTQVVWECVFIRADSVYIRDWIRIGIVGFPEEENDDQFTDTTWIMNVTALIGGSYSGGIGIAAMSLYTQNGTPLNRTIAVQMTVRNRGTGDVCAASGWQQAPTQRPTWDFYTTKPLVGYCPPGSTSGTYYTRAQARFWSISLNRWIYSPVVSSPGLFFPGTAPSP